MRYWCCVSALVALLLFGQSRTVFAQEMMVPPPPLMAGVHAPKIVTRLVNVPGTFSTPALHGKVVLVDYWATWCGPCRMATPTLERLHRKYARQGLRVLGMNVDDARTIGDVKPFIKAFGITYPIAVLSKANVQSAIGYCVNGIPSQYLIDKKGIVRWSQAGYGPDEERYLSIMIKKLLAE